MLAGPLWLRKVTTDSHVNVECSDHRYPKLKIENSEQTLDNYE
jgi:hypothetical protein